MITITLENFERDLLAASAQVPVLLDIWAEWCGPCKQLSPVLDKLEAEYAGRFILAKVNADEEPEITGQLSQMFGVRSIPFCVMFAGGQPVDGFVGALPEAQIRAFLDKHVPSAEEAEAVEELAEASELAASGQPGSALEKLQEAIALDPSNDEARLEYVKLLLQAQRVDDAKTAFLPIASKATGPLADARVAAFALYVDACAAAPGLRAPQALAAAIAVNKRDFEARYDLARGHFAAGRYTEAMDELLEIVMRDKKWNDEAARKAYVAVLEVMTKPQPKAPKGPAQGKPADAKPALEVAGRQEVAGADPVIDQYRRKLSMALF
ncbi:MAG: tetratricopeptide repeat protein [Aquabacterium sp.]|nr:MAG: tetratricopeptide repeat protein [Aquabacterium sp.]